MSTPPQEVISARRGSLARATSSVRHSVAPVAEAIRPRILLVDDEDMLLDVWARQLERAGLEIWTGGSARDAAGALARANGDFDAVVCDLHMPGGGGIELYRFIETEYAGLQHRVVFITGGVFSSKETDFLHTTGNPVLDKLCGIEQVVDIVRDWATRRRARSAEPLPIGPRDVTGQADRPDLAGGRRRWSADGRAGAKA